MIERRRLLLGIAALIAVPSPAIVRASSLMPISVVGLDLGARPSYSIVIEFRIVDMSDGSFEWFPLDRNGITVKGEGLMEIA